MNNIKQLRKQKKITQDTLAIQLGVSRSTIAMYEIGASEPDFDTLMRLSKILDSDPLYVMGLTTKNTSINEGVKIPVLGHIPAGIPIAAIQDVLDYEEISADMASTGEFFALKVKGTSMTPEITDGEIAIVRQQADANSGDICVVMVNGDDATLKRIKKSEQGLTLIPTNTIEFTPTFYTNEEIEKLPVRIIGKVVETRKSW